MLWIVTVCYWLYLQCQSRKLENLSYVKLSYMKLLAAHLEILWFIQSDRATWQCFKVSVDDNQKQIKGFSWHLKWILHWWPVKALETPSSWWMHGIKWLLYCHRSLWLCDISISRTLFTVTWSQKMCCWRLRSRFLR